MHVSYSDGKQPPLFAPPVGRVALVSGLEPDEPVFVFRARDAAAVPLISLYREMVYSNFSDERMQGIIDDLAAMVEWRRSHSVRDAD